MGTFSDYDYNSAVSKPAPAAQAAPAQPAAVNMPDPSAGPQPWLTQTLGPNNLLPWEQNFSPQVADIAKQKTDQVTGDLNGNDTLRSTLFRNVGQGSFVGGPGARPGGSMLAAGSGPNPMSDAISRRSADQVNQQLQGMQTSYEANRPEMESKQLASAADIYAKQRQNQIQNFQEQWAFQMARQKAYTDHSNQQQEASDSFLGQAIGAVGGAVGKVLGGIL